MHWTLQTPCSLEHYLVRVIITVNPNPNHRLFIEQRSITSICCRFVIQRAVQPAVPTNPQQIQVVEFGPKGLSVGFVVVLAQTPLFRFGDRVVQQAWHVFCCGFLVGPLYFCVQLVVDLP